MFEKKGEKNELVTSLTLDFHFQTAIINTVAIDKSQWMRIDKRAENICPVELHRLIHTGHCRAICWSQLILFELSFILCIRMHVVQAQKLLIGQRELHLGRGKAFDLQFALYEYTDSVVKIQLGSTAYDKLGRWPDNYVMCDHIPVDWQHTLANVINATEIVRQEQIEIVLRWFQVSTRLVVFITRIRPVYDLGQIRTIGKVEDPFFDQIPFGIAKVPIGLKVLDIVKGLEDLEPVIRRVYNCRRIGQMRANLDLRHGIVEIIAIYEDPWRWHNEHAACRTTRIQVLEWLVHVIVFEPVARQVHVRVPIEFVQFEFGRITARIIPKIIVENVKRHVAYESIGCLGLIRTNIQTACESDNKKIQTTFQFVGYPRISLESTRFYLFDDFEMYCL